MNPMNFIILLDRDRLPEGFEVWPILVEVSKNAKNMLPRLIYWLTFGIFQLSLSFSVWPISVKWWDFYFDIAENLVFF